MSQNDARALLIRYAAGELDAASEAQAQAVLADPALRRFYAEVLMQQVLLGQLASERRLAAELAPAPTVSARRASGSGRRPLSLRRSRIRPRRSAPWFAVAATLVLFAGAALIFIGPHARPPLPDAGQAPPTVAGNRPAGRGEGVRLVEGRGLRLLDHGVATGIVTGSPLPYGVEITGDAEASGLIAFTDGSTLALKPGGIRLTIDAPGRIRLNQGDLEATVTKQHEGDHFSVTTPTAVVTVIGTQFTVGSAAAGTHLHVAEGRVRFAEPSTDHTRDVTAGHAAASGHGLLGIYFRGEDFSQEVFRRVDSDIHFWWGTGAPDPRLGSALFSIRWQGWLLPEHDEEYTIYAVADDTAKVWLDGKLVVDNPQGFELEKAEQNGANRGKIVLKKNVPVRIVYEMTQHYGSSCADLEWSSPSTLKVLIPSGRMVPDPEQAP